MGDTAETQRNTLTDAELRAIAYFAIGVGSEGVEAGRDISNRLSFAGNIRNGVMTPVGNSGLSIGTLQTDMGQHPDVAPALVGAYQAWAAANHPNLVLTDAQRTQTISDLSRDGNAINSQGGRTLDATVKTRLDEFLASRDGINYVHSNDLREVDKLMTRVIPKLQETSLYRDSTIEDQVKLATVVAKAYNQSERWGGRILDRIQDDYVGDNKYTSLADVNQAIKDLPDGRNEYMRTGRDAALQGAETFIALRNSDQRSPLHQAWQNVLANPLVNPTQTDQDAAHPNLSSEYTAVKGLFLQKAKAPALIEAIDQGGAYGYNITNSRGQSRPQSTSLYAAGDDFVVMDGNGIGKAYVGGTWSDVDRANLTRVNNRNGTVDLNISRDGSVERLLHVDPNAPVLRPVQQTVEPTQPAPTEQRDWGPFTPNQAPMTAPVIAPRSFGSSPGVDGNERQRAIEADRTASNAIPASWPVDPSITNPALAFPPPISAAEERDRDERESRDREQQASDPLSARGPFNDPYLDRAYAALQAGDSDQLDRIAIEFAQSAEGQRMAQMGDQLLAQQQLLEQQQSQEQQQAQTRQGPVMRL